MGRFFRRFYCERCQRHPPQWYNWYLSEDTMQCSCCLCDWVEPPFRITRTITRREGLSSNFNWLHDPRQDRVLPDNNPK